MNNHEHDKLFSTISKYQSRVESFLKGHFEKLGKSQKYYGQIRLCEAMEYSTLNGGKRFRAILTYLVGNFLAIDNATLDYIAAAMEMIHAFSLIHDDLPAMDNDDLRRGKPTCHLQLVLTESHPV